MSVYNEKTKRRVVPRWRNSTVAAHSKDFQPLKPRTLPKPSDKSLLPTLAEQFDNAPDLGRAAELLAAAIRLGQSDDAKKAAQFILAARSDSPAILLDAAVSVLNGTKLPFLTEQITEDSTAIARLRTLLRVRPRSANLWVDLARHQAALGETNKAQKSMRIALALAPNHRWILRSASRLLLHAGHPGEAHKLLTRHARTRHDPWLLAAEIASAQIAKKAPQFIPQARDMLRPNAMAPAQISELATAVATVDLESGSRRNVRRLLKLAIKEPTENALAQVEWAERDSTADLELEAIVNRTPDAYEASCWVKYNEGQIEAALAAAREWQLDETFATRPVGMVCYLAAFLDDYATVIHSARAALATHPDEVLHRNNLAYALLSQGRILDSGNGQELVEYIDYIRKRVNAREIDALQATANAGLLFYRLGRLEEGKQLYEAAMSAAEKFGDHLVRAHAAVMNAREAILFRAKWATEALATAHKLTKRIASPGLVFYLRKLNSLIKDPDLHAQVLSPQSAGRFETTKRIVDPFKDLRIEQTESGPVLWVPRHLMKK